MNHQDPSVPGASNLMQLVGTLAEARGQSYTHYDHTLWGTSLAQNWSGDSVQGDKTQRDRAYFDQHAGEFDTFVLTEVVPLEESLPWADSAFYLRKFYCGALGANPDAELFIYETWPDSQTAVRVDVPRSFEERIVYERSLWEKLADQGLSGDISNPGRMGHLLAYVGVRESHCTPTRPLRFIPAGSALLALSKKLRELGPGAPKLADGSPLTLDRLFQNPASGWRYDRPPGTSPNTSKLDARDPAQDRDDIHPSAVGSYFIGLVAYAAIYRTDPAGLPALQGVGEESARLLQSIAWETVVADPRAGVLPAATATR